MITYTGDRAAMLESSLTTLIKNLFKTSNLVQDIRKKIDAEVKNFNDFYWHDAVITNIEIDRHNPGKEDTIAFAIEWPEGQGTATKEAFGLLTLKKLTSLPEAPSQ